MTFFRILWTFSTVSTFIVVNSSAILSCSVTVGLTKRFRLTPRGCPGTAPFAISFLNSLCFSVISFASASDTLFPETSAQLIVTVRLCCNIYRNSQQRQECNWFSSTCVTLHCETRKCLLQPILKLWHLPKRLREGFAFNPVLNLF